MRKLLALLLGLVTAAGSMALIANAASLGGVTSTALGSDDTVVASCDTDGVTLSYTTAWDATDARYEVTDATVGGIDAACIGSTVSITLSNGTTSIGTGSTTVSGASHTLTIAAAPSAEAVSSASVLIA